MTILDRNFRVVTPSTGFTDGRMVSYKTASFTAINDFTNYTGLELYVKMQNNIPICVPSCTTTASVEETRPHLEIKTTYAIHTNDGILGTMQVLNALLNNHQVLSNDAEELRKRLADLYAHDASKTNKINFTFSVYKRVLEDDLRKSKITYIREIDVAVMRDRTMIHIPHPNSNEGLQQADVENDRRYHNQAGVFVRVVDNEGLAGQRYFYSAKQLVTVPSSLDTTVQNGVYCTISTMDVDGLLTAKTEFMSFKEAEERIGLYRTKEDAITHGDPEMAIRAEEARNKAEERRLSAELTELKHKSAMEKLNKEEELSRMNHTIELLKQESTHLKESLDIKKVVREDSFETKKRFRDDDFETRKRYREDYYDDRHHHRDDHYERRSHERKDYYDERSHSRKDHSEFIKYLPGLVLGIAGTFAVLRSRGN